MAGAWFPMWLLVLMTVLYASIVAVHWAHLVSQRGTARLWTAAHVLMAVGMLVMVLPTDRMLVDGALVALVYVAAALGGLVVAVRAWRGSGGAQLWLVAVVDLAAMAYMFAPGSVQSLVVGLLLTVFLVVESAYWASGYFAETAARDGLACVPAVEIHAVPSTVDAGRVALAEATPIAPTTGVRSTPSAGLLTQPWVLRATMALMALGMAYMLAAMTLPAMTSSGGGHVHGMAGR